MIDTVRDWAFSEFGQTSLGDIRRRRRLISMATLAAERPSGKVSAVFDRDADREGAYDFLENPHVEAAALAESMFSATGERARGEIYVFVSVDGASLTLSDENGAKGFGSLSISHDCVVKGLKVVNALAISSSGVPLGLIDQIYWSRVSDPKAEGLTSSERRNLNRLRPFEEKESAKFIDAVRSARARLAAVGVKPWIVIDSESDNRDILVRLHEENCFFTVRAHANRVLVGSKLKLQETLDAAPRLGVHEVEVPRNGRRPARTVRVEVHAALVDLKFVGRLEQPNQNAPLYAVRVRELDKACDSLEWLLYTNVPVFTHEHAKVIIESYRSRWRIEEFHRTWKEGHCNIEEAQLRSESAMVKWATILAAVATRIERIKYLARNAPAAPATIELSPDEIEALRLDRESKSTTPVKLTRTPTILEATHWVAKLGGWIGPRNGNPGATIIARGLQRLTFLVEGIALARRLNARPSKRAKT